MRKIWHKFLDWGEEKWEVYKGFFTYASAVSDMKYELQEKWGIMIDGAYRMHMIFRPSNDAVEVYGVDMVEDELKKHLSKLNKYLRVNGVSELCARERVNTLNAYNIAVVIGYRYGRSTRIMMSLIAMGVFSSIFILMLMAKLIFF